MNLPTEHYVPCSALVHGKLHTADTTDTLSWAPQLLHVIDQACGK